MKDKNKHDSGSVYHNYNKEEIEEIIEVAKDVFTKEYIDEGLDYLAERNHITSKLQGCLDPCCLDPLYEIEVKLSINKKEAEE